MTQAAPTVSIITSTYNGAAWIAETVESALAQSFRDFEMIVVDDASPDDTLERLRAFDDPRLVILPSERNGGPIAARNRAFAAARGRYVAGLDQDDICLPERLAQQVAYLDTHPDTVLVATAKQDLYEGGRIREDQAMPAVTSPALIAWRMLFRNPLGWSTVMMRADAARRLPVFERSERFCAEDFDLYHRLAKYGTIARIDTPLLLYRRHEGGASRRFTERMMASATDVLADAYKPVFGMRAPAAAARVIRQLSGHELVRHGADLAHLGRIMTRVHEHFVRERRPGPADLAMILDEYARLWWAVAHAAVRAGHLSIATAMAARPKTVALRHSRPARLLMSGLIGSGRALRDGWKTR